MKRVVLFLICYLISANLVAQDNNDEAIAYQYYQTGDYEKAVPFLDKLFNRTKNDSHFELYFDALIKIKKYHQAENLVKDLMKQSPKKLSYKIALGRVYQEKGSSTEANKIYKSAVQDVSKNEFEFRNLANDFYRFGAYDMAIYTFQKGREVLQDPQLFVFELISIYKFKKDKALLINEYLNALPIHPQLMLQAQSSIANLFEENSDYQFLESALLKRIQKDPQNETYVELLIWQYLQQGEYEMALRQLLARDKRAQTTAELLFNTANTFVMNKGFATAVKAYEYIIGKGAASEFFVPAKIQLVNAKYELAIAGQINQLSIKNLSDEFSQLITQYGLTSQTLFAVRKLAYLQAYHLSDFPAAEKTLEQALNVTAISAADLAQLKLDLGDIYVLNQQPWEAVLIYEQVSKGFENQTIGSEARYRSARLSFYQGNFKFAKSQADVLKAATSQLIANDALNLSLLISDNLQSKNDSLALLLYAKAEMLVLLNKNTAALSQLDSINVKSPGNSLIDDVLIAKAKIFVKNKDYETATVYLKELITTQTTSIWLDDAIFLLADLYEHNLNNKEYAKALYQQLITNHPGSMLNAEARKRYRNLRGDNLGS